MIFAPRFRMCAATLTVSLLAALSAHHAQAQISFVDMFRSASSQQTGNGNALTSLGYFFTADLTSQNAGDFTGVSLSFLGPASPVTLSPSVPTVFHYQTPFYATQMAMDADFPMGTYTYSATGGNAGPATATLDYSADGYPTAQPYLTGTDYTDLQNVSADAPITVHFSPFASDPSAAAQYEFFTIFDSTLGSLVYDAGFLPSATPSITIGANTLASGHDFVYELIDSSRFSVNGTGAQFTPELAFDLRTTGQFSTRSLSVPEPSSIALIFSLTMTSAGFLTRRRKKTRQAA